MGEHAFLNEIVEMVFTLFAIGRWLPFHDEREREDFASCHAACFVSSALNDVLQECELLQGQETCPFLFVYHFTCHQSNVDTIFFSRRLEPAIVGRSTTAAPVVFPTCCFRVLNLADDIVERKS